MKKLILIILFLILSFSFACAMTLQETEPYVGNFCYVKYLKYEQSDIEIYLTNIGKILDIIYDNGYKIVLLDYKADIYLIKIEKIKQIKILR